MANPQPAVATRDPLSAERIVAAALELMDREGMAALSMRKLGARLSVQAMSLYGYFPNKDALLTAASNALFAKIQTPAPEIDVFDGLRAVMLSFYQLVEEHRSIVDLLFNAPSAPALAGRGEADRGALRSVGFGEDAAAALATLVSFTVGSMHQGRNKTPQQRRTDFEFGLDIVLAGLRLEASRRAKNPPTRG